MMAVSAAISEQAASLGVSILIGGALFLLYDIFRIFRRVVPHGNFWIGVEDYFTTIQKTWEKNYTFFQKTIEKSVQSS